MTRVGLRRRWRRALQSYVDHIVLPIATTIVCIGAIIVVVKVAPSRLDPTSGEREFYGWGDVAVLIAVLVTVLGFLSLIMALQARYGETRAERIQRLTKALQEAMQAIAEINTEIEEGAQRLEELEAQTSVQRELAGLTESEAAAVREALKTELSRERRRSLLRDFAMMLIGAALSYVLTRSF